MKTPSRRPAPAATLQLLRTLPMAAALLLFAADAAAVRPAGQPGVDWGDPKGRECVECHMSENPGLYWEWNHSQHGQNGVTCIDCHEAKEGEIDAWRHEDTFVSIVVTPKDCSKCHEKEFE